MRLIADWYSLAASRDLPARVAIAAKRGKRLARRARRLVLPRVVPGFPWQSCMRSIIGDLEGLDCLADYPLHCCGRWYGLWTDSPKHCLRRFLRQRRSLPQLALAVRVVVGRRSWFLVIMLCEAVRTYHTALSRGPIHALRVSASRGRRSTLNVPGSRSSRPRSSTRYVAA